MGHLKCHSSIKGNKIGIIVKATPYEWYRNNNNNNYMQPY